MKNIIGESLAYSYGLNMAKLNIPLTQALNKITSWVEPTGTKEGHMKAVTDIKRAYKEYKNEKLEDMICECCGKGLEFREYEHNGLEVEGVTCMDAECPMRDTIL